MLLDPKAKDVLCADGDDDMARKKNLDFFSTSLGGCWPAGWQASKAIP